VYFSKKRFLVQALFSFSKIVERSSSLNDAIDHGKLKHADLAKKSTEEAVTHLKAAQRTRRLW
jgi:hypothetical protein